MATKRMTMKGTDTRRDSAETEKSGALGGSAMNRFFEELSLNAWPALRTELYDGWVLRFAGGYTKRSNSVNIIYESRLPLEEKIEACERRYRVEGLPIVFKLVDALYPAELERMLEERGYVLDDESSVRVADLSMDAGPARESPVTGSGHAESRRNDGADRSRNLDDGYRLIVEPEISPKWIDYHAACSLLDDEAKKRSAIILRAIARGTVVAVRIEREGAPAACGLGVMERGYVSLLDIVVDRNLRRLGLGRHVVRTILERAADHGARTAYLQVVVGNTAAERLYDEFGFREAYRYRYRVLRAR